MFPWSIPALLGVARLPPPNSVQLVTRETDWPRTSCRALLLAIIVSLGAVCLSVQGQQVLTFVDPSTRFAIGHREVMSSFPRGPRTLASEYGVGAPWRELLIELKSSRCHPT